MWLCRGCPQCTDVSKVNGNSSVRNGQRKAMRNASPGTAELGAILSTFAGAGVLILRGSPHVGQPTWVEHPGSAHWVDRRSLVDPTVAQG